MWFRTLLFYCLCTTENNNESKLNISDLVKRSFGGLKLSPYLLLNNLSSLFLACNLFRWISVSSAKSGHIRYSCVELWPCWYLFFKVFKKKKKRKYLVTDNFLNNRKMFCYVINCFIHPLRMMANLSTSY